MKTLINVAKLMLLIKEPWTEKCGQQATTKNSEFLNKSVPLVQLVLQSLHLLQEPQPVVFQSPRKQNF